MVDKTGVEAIKANLADFEQVWPIFQEAGITRSSALLAFLNMAILTAIENLDCSGCDCDIDDLNDDDKPVPPWK